jgi:hypothetical protein
MLTLAPEALPPAGEDAERRPGARWMGMRSGMVG